MEDVFSTSVTIMSPSMLIFVIMLLAVVYSETIFKTDYTEDNDKTLTKNFVQFDLCDLGSKIKMCKKANFWREILKKIDNSRHYPEYFTRQYIQDYFEHEDVKDESIKVDEKRKPHLSYASARNHMQMHSCPTKKDQIYLGENYYPRVLNFLTCNRTSNQSTQMCSEVESCQPIIRKMKVLLRDTLNDPDPIDSPEELTGCWRLSKEEIEIHAGCECKRTF